jgi:hypothetical protein
VTHPSFVKAIAKQYYKIYRSLGYDDAKEYSDRMIRDDKELRKDVAKEVAGLMAPSTKKNGGKK